MIRIDRRQLLLWLGLIAWCGLLIMLSYSAVLRLPLISDDWTQLPYAASRTVAEIWEGAKGPAYYRPLAFTVWKILYVILGRHDEVVLHALNIVLYFVSALMVGWLAGRLWAPAQDVRRMDWRRCYLCAGLFVLFPFSYDAIAWIAAIMHPLVVAFILLSVMSYVKARETGSRMWTVLGLILVFLSPFVHENGVLAGPLIAAIELTWPPAGPQPVEPVWRRLSRVALWLVPALIWWLIWRSVPTPRGPESLALNEGKALWRNSAYFLQGPAYPVTWLGGLISERLAINNTVVAVGLAAIVLAGAALVQWRTGADRRAWLPWLWIGLTSAPIVLFLDYKYVSSSPRMMMLMSVGAAWLWTDVGVRLLDGGQATITRRRFNQVLVGAFVTILMIQNIMFIHDRMRPWELGGSVIRQMVDQTVTANAQGQPAVFINLPAWIAPAQIVLAVGQNGVGLLSTYYPLEDIIRSYTGQAGRVASLKDEGIRTAAPSYYVGLRDSTTDWPSLAQSGGQIFVTTYAPDQIRIQPVGALHVPTPATQPLAHFDRFASLLDATATHTATGLQINLIWQVHEPPPEDVTIFLHVLDSSGQLIAQADGDALGGSYPFWQWPKDLTVSDLRAIDVADSNVSVRVGLYGRATGERLTAMSQDGIPYPDQAVPVPIKE